MKALLICPYFGDLPDWWERYEAEEIPRLERQGYDMLLGFNEADFHYRCKEILGIEPPPMANTGKTWDFRPTLGLLYEQEARAYDWWGHTDFDCVYGHLPTSELLEDHGIGGAPVDAYTDCAYDYLAGPFSLYRNRPWVNRCFTLVPEWKKNVCAAEPTGWQETSFSKKMAEMGNVLVEDTHAYTEAELDVLRRDGDRLFVLDREMPFAHFRRTKKWPLP